MNKGFFEGLSLKGSLFLSNPSLNDPPLDDRWGIPRPFWGGHLGVAGGGGSGQDHSWFELICDRRPVYASVRLRF